MNSKNSKTSDPRRLLLIITDKTDLRRKGKYIASSNFRIHDKWKNIEKSYKNNKFQKSALTFNEKFELTDGSYFISDIQNYFWYILKKHGEKIVKPSIRIHINKTEKRITFKIKTGYYLQFLTSETMKLFESTKSKIRKR